MKTEVSLPGPEFVVHQWNAGEGSFVNKGDVIALVRNKNTAADDVSVKAHCRPRMRGRAPPAAAAKPAETAIEHAEPGKVMPIVAGMTGLLHRTTTNSGGDQTTSSLVLGFISSCTHPAIIDNMCAVCGASMAPDEDARPTAYIPSDKPEPEMSNVTVSGGITMKISETEALSISQAQTDQLLHHKKLSLVLDLDHTLVHATADPRASQYEDREDVRTLLLPTENGHIMHHRVKLRPHLKEFLEQPLYEITVYTAGTRLYAEQITMVLSRYVVGAHLDHYGILKLQNVVKVAEKKLQEQLSKSGDAGEGEKDSMAVESHNEDAKAAAEEGASPPRKRVRFGEPAPNAKTDKTAITEEGVAKLRAELKEAEDKENEALEVRQQIFGSRIFSRTDVGDLGRDVKSLKRIFPCGGTMSVIVDDREDVWANAIENSKEPPHNLLVVRPYHWKPFAGFADVNNAAGADLSKSTSSKKENSPADADIETDEQLLWTKDIAQRVHERYYARDGKMTVPEILKEMRKETLRGCKIILSGLVPLHKQSEDYKGPRHPLLRYTDSMGSKLMTAVDPSLTHVVAAADGTEKIAQARRIPGCFVVTSLWLMECLWTLTRRREMDHLLGSPPMAVRGVDEPTPASRRVNGSNARASNSTDEDDEDDDFADELWDAGDG
jgi:RNA polymerase II subunit A-like phosphatase